MHFGYNWRCREEGFEGDLAAVSFQSCEGEQGFRGFGVYDVTNPAQPEKLALVATNKAASGSHEIWLDTRGGHADVYTAIIPTRSSPPAGTPTCPQSRHLHPNDAIATDGASPTGLHGASASVALL